jgi:hypothetical protein
LEDEMNNKSVFLENIHYFFAQTDGTYNFPNSSVGDLLKQAKKEIEQLQSAPSNSDYTKCTNEVFKYVTDNICDEGITKKVIKTILKKHFA